MTIEEKHSIEKIMYRFELLKHVISDARNNQEEGTPHSQDVRFILAIEAMELINESLKKLCRTVTEGERK